MTEQTLTWTKDASGWVNVYRAKGKRGTYVAKKTGGRHLKWEVRLITADDPYPGTRVSPANTLRSCKEAAENHEARAA